MILLKVLVIDASASITALRKTLNPNKRKDLGRIRGKRPAIPFVQCAAGNGPAFPWVGLDLHFRGD